MLKSCARLALVSQESSLDPGCDGGEIVLSLKDGEVWASWPGDRAAVRLGEHESVVEMMRNFIRQCEAADRLLDRAHCDALAN